MKSRARVGATLSALAATATAALLISATAQAATTATQAPTRTTLSGPGIPLGGVAKLKAVVKPVIGSGQPTGTVTFSEGATVLGTVSLALVNNVETAKLNVPGLTIGDHDFTARYNGATNFAPSTSLPLTLTVGPAASVTTFTTSTKNVVLLAPAKLKAVVKPKVAGLGSPSGGTVTFSEGATELGTVSLALSAGVWTAKLDVPNLSLGDHIFTATFNGSADLAPADPKNLTITDVKASRTTTVTSEQLADGNTKITAKVARLLPYAYPSGIVVFAIDGLGLQTISLNAFGAAVLTTTSPLDPGPHTVKATYSGDGNYLPSTGTLSFTI